MGHFGFSSQFRRPTTQDKCARFFIDSVESGDADGRGAGQPARADDPPASVSQPAALNRHAGGGITLLPYWEMKHLLPDDILSKKKQKNKKERRKSADSRNQRMFNSLTRPGFTVK